MRMENYNKVAAVVLAAGYSSRAPGFKPLLPLGATSVIEVVARSLREAAVSEIIVVLGHRSDEIVPVLDRIEVNYITNEQHDAGMITSVRAGVRALSASAEAFLVLPVDMPLVKSSTMQKLYDFWQTAKPDVVYPVFQGMRGHPILISARLREAILSWDTQEGLNVFLRGYEQDAYWVEVKDAGILKDLDTAHDYQEIINLYTDDFTAKANLS